MFPQMTIAQLVYDNERHYLSEEQIHVKVIIHKLTAHSL